MIANPLQAFAFFWVVISFLGVLGNKQLFLDLALRLNFEVSPQQLARFYGFKLFYMNCVFRTLVPLSFGWTILELLLYLPTVFHSRIKHAVVDFHFVREQVTKGLIRVRHLPAYAQIVDVFTKPLSGQSFTRLCNLLRITSALGLRGAVNQTTSISRDANIT